MLDGKLKIILAKDISVAALETAKVVTEHNKKIAANGTGESKAFIYARSSKANDISIETQRKACLQYAEKHNLQLLPFGYQIDNNVPARNMKNLKHELGFWKNEIPNGSHLIIYCVDRLSRNLAMGMEFLDKMASRNISVHFISLEIVYSKNTSAAGRAMIQQELQTAEKFSNIASEKIRKTLQRLREEGHVFGLSPYGFKHVKVDGIRKKLPDNKEQQVIQKIKKQYREIVLNWKNMHEMQDYKKTPKNILRVLVRWCVRTGLRYRNDKQFSCNQLRNIITINNNN
jgi:DNA invertase Pin-like site-specific DNA recombinase